MWSVRLNVSVMSRMFVVVSSNLLVRPKHVSVQSLLKWSILWYHYIRQYQSLYHNKCKRVVSFEIKNFSIKLPRQETQCYSSKKSEQSDCISYCSDCFVALIWSCCCFTVCQEVVWEAFKIFLERLPSQEEYQNWMSQCQTDRVSIREIGTYFSQSEEHLALVHRVCSIRHV